MVAGRVTDREPHDVDQTALLCNDHLPVDLVRSLGLSPLSHKLNVNDRVDASLNRERI